MRAFWEIVKAGYRRHARYRAAIAASLFTNTVFGAIRASLMLTAIAAAGGSIGGYDAITAATYVWLGQGLLGPISMWGFGEVTNRIKSGDVAIDFLRPMPPLLAWVGADLGRAASQLLPRLLPMLVIGALTTGISLSPRIGDWALFVVSLTLGVVLGFLSQVLVNLVALWTLETRGFLGTYMVVLSLLSGFLVPVSWFPGWLQVVANLTWFPSIFQTPINVAMGVTVAGVSPLAAVGIQLFWLAVLTCLTVATLRLGTRRLVIQGG